MGYSLFEQKSTSESKTTPKFVENTVSKPDTKHETHLNNGHGVKKGTACDAFGSAVGDRGNATASDIIAGGMPAGYGMADGGAAMASVMAAQGAGPHGGNGGGASSMMECEGFKNFKECLNGLALAYPKSDAVSEIRTMFDNLFDSETTKKVASPIYHSADGLSRREDVDTEAHVDAVAQLAAACEATLNAFKKQTGIDYLEFRKRSMNDW